MKMVLNVINVVNVDGNMCKQLTTRSLIDAYHNESCLCVIQVENYAEEEQLACEQ